MSTTAEIAESLKKIFALFVEIGYISEECVEHVPHNEDDFRLDVAEEHGMDDSAIDFIMNVPWLRDELVDLVVNSQIICWGSKKHLKASRKLITLNQGRDFEVRPGFKRSWLSLTMPWSALETRRTAGELLVLDTSQGTIRRWKGHHPDDLEDLASPPACEVLDKICASYRNLHQIPYLHMIFENINSYDEQDDRHSRALNRLHLAAVEARWPEPRVMPFSLERFRERARHHIQALQLPRLPGLTSNSLGRAPDLDSDRAPSSPSSDGSDPQQQNGSTANSGSSQKSA